MTFLTDGCHFRGTTNLWSFGDRQTFALHSHIYLASTALEPEQSRYDRHRSPSKFCEFLLAREHVLAASRLQIEMVRLAGRLVRSCFRYKRSNSPFLLPEVILIEFEPAKKRRAFLAEAVPWNSASSGTEKYRVVFRISAQNVRSSISCPASSHRRHEELIKWTCGNLQNWEET